ncbi:hypothetical protein [Fibrobacter sp. UWB13]|uniref:hypothetical protein n=1 Tax=Fibrobacter sp. UWB13 TaxID=1896204 RepID=UPI000A0E9177|nr:hypothetical protein [Fibrobacter sp. UWB13]SMG15752.1 hypothetical protein SAMN05720489_0775 [Fibrobacter sp. UWB13]
MAKKKDKVFSNVAETAKESDAMRMRRIDGSQNGATLRTRVVRDKTKYNRNLKHKKSLADAGDFPFYGALTPSIRLLRRRRNLYSIE